MLALDICAGAGGLSRGLRMAGFDVCCAVEVDKYVAETYRTNFPKVEVIEDDIRRVRTDVLRQKLQYWSQPLTAVVAGLPCQGFSESNRRTRNVTNPKNLLYREVLRLIRELTPRWFIVENVAGIATLESGMFLGRVLRAFRSVGYKVKYKVLNASEYGVPQVRRRAFIVGNRVGCEFEFPRVTAGQDGMRQTTVRDAIRDLRTLRNGATVDSRDYRMGWEEASAYARELRSEDRLKVTGNVVSKNSEHVLARYRYIRPGENWRAIPTHLMGNYGTLGMVHTGIYHRLAWNAPSKVIGNFRKNMLIHPTQQRGLSIREAARLQSFPDEHVFVGPLNQRQQQVGDAVPPLLAKAVAQAVVEADTKVRGEVLKGKGGGD